MELNFCYAYETIESGLMSALFHFKVVYWELNVGVSAMEGIL